MSQIELLNISKQIMSMSGQLCDMEWRIFKEWQRVIPSEPFESYKKESIIKKAKKENINTDNLI